ncbi:MAG: hypothetical protein M3Y04_00225 [Actinomycetota bacterium]|nr:hypothetical protein [Actinomycetota bacterium]
MSPKPLVTVRHGHLGTGSTVILAPLEVAGPGRAGQGQDPQEHAADQDRAGAGADVGLVACRHLTLDGLRRTFDSNAESAPERSAWSVGVIDAAGPVLDAAIDLGATYVVDQGVADPSQLAEIARRGAVVVVGTRSCLSSGEAMLDVCGRHDAVMARGAPATSVVLELPVGASRSPEGVATRATGAPMGVLVGGIGGPEGFGVRRDHDFTANAADDADRGRTIGMLTADMVSGVTTVRTADPRTALRVRAVVAHLVAATIAEGGLDLSKPPELNVSSKPIGADVEGGSSSLTSPAGLRR